MPSTDAYGNPDVVAAGEFVEDEWGNATVSRVVRRYPSYSAWAAAHPLPGNGETYAVSDRMFVVRGGRLVGVASALIPPTSVSKTPSPGSGATTKMDGVLGLSIVPWDVDYLVTWNGAAAGIGTGGVQPTIRDNANPGTVYGSMPEILRPIGASATWTCVAKISVPLNTALTLAFYTAINGAEVNVGGVAFAEGYPV